MLILENENDDLRLRKYYVKDYGMVKSESAELNKDSGEYEVFITTEQMTIYLPPEQTPSHFKATIGTNYVADFHSGWQISPGTLKTATKNGKGETAGEEGEAFLVIESLATSETTIYTLKDNYFGQFTPKKVEWIDENRLFVIIGPAYGMVTTGGKLYELNIQDNIITPVIEILGAREEIMNVKVNKDGTFTYQIPQETELYFICKSYKQSFSLFKSVFQHFFSFVSLLQVYLLTEMQLPIINIMSTKIELIK